MRLKLIFARRPSIGSFAIRAFTWSKWSHVAVCYQGYVIDATLLHGVSMRTAWEFHQTYRDTEEIEIDCNAEAAWSWLKMQIGKPYDWTALFGFVFRRGRWNEDDSWFCSELSEAALIQGGVRRLREELSRVTPRDVWMVSLPCST